jgi:hypothetical protein
MPTPQGAEFLDEPLVRRVQTLKLRVLRVRLVNGRAGNAAPGITLALRRYDFACRIDQQGARLIGCHGR